MTPTIEIGDYVTVNFHQPGITLGTQLKVLWKPMSAGDSWKFQDERNRLIHEVSEGCTVTKELP